MRAKFQLGQDERDDVFADLMVGLTQGDNGGLRAWMRQFDPGRC